MRDLHYTYVNLKNKNITKMIKSRARDIIFMKMKKIIFIAYGLTNYFKSINTQVDDRF